MDLHDPERLRSRRRAHKAPTANDERSQSLQRRRSVNELHFLVLSSFISVNSLHVMHLDVQLLPNDHAQRYANEVHVYATNCLSVGH